MLANYCIQIRSTVSESFLLFPSKENETYILEVIATVKCPLFWVSVHASIISHQ